MSYDYQFSFLPRSSSSINMQSLGLFLLALCSVSFAAECFNNQKRTTTIPTADQIRAVITSPGSLETICGGTWRVGDEQQLQNTFSHGRM